MKSAQPLPPIEAGRYLVEAFRDLGRFSSTGFGPAVLTWAEIDAFARQTNAITDPWEARSLREMSAAFIEGLEIGKNPLGRAPWEG